MTDRHEASIDPVAWDATSVPDLTEHTIIVTGASSGLGLILTRHLVGHAATVLMAVRDPSKGEKVRRDLLASRSDGALEVWPLDLLDLDSVRRFAAAIHDDGRAIDVLVNNAGIANQPRRLSPQGYESQFATNHLGHFALTGLLLESLAQSSDPRVVTVGSNIYHWAKSSIDFDDLTGEKGYSPGGAYLRSSWPTSSSASNSSGGCVGRAPQSAACLRIPGWRRRRCTSTSGRRPSASS